MSPQNRIMYFLSNGEEGLLLPQSFVHVTALKMDDGETLIKCTWPIHHIEEMFLKFVKKKIQWMTLSNNNVKNLVKKEGSKVRIPFL